MKRKDQLAFGAVLIVVAGFLFDWGRSIGRREGWDAGSETAKRIYRDR